MELPQSPMTGMELYLRNAAGMLTDLAAQPPELLDDGRLFRVAMPPGVRLIALAPTTPVVPAGQSYVFEDAFGEPAEGVPRYPVMVRPAGPLRADGVRVSEVHDPDALAVAERVMIDGFPLRRYQPVRRGVALPPAILTRPGWRVWLVHRDGEPAAAMFTYDDGVALGAYRLVTMPEHRGHGLARAVLTTAVAASPDRPSVLVATPAGRSLYESLGFTTVGWLNWHRSD